MFRPGPLLTAVDRACCWFVLLFAFGMVGANLLFETRKDYPSKITGFPWDTTALILAAGLGAVVFVRRPPDNPCDPSLLPAYTWSTDLAAGLVTICLILCCARHLSIELFRGPGRKHFYLATFILRIFESRPACALGRFSYTLYLVHLPFVTLVLVAITHLKLPSGTRAPLMWVVSLSGALLFSDFLSRFIERPFTSQANLRN